MVLITQEELTNPIRYTAFNPWLTGLLALGARKVSQDPSVITKLLGPSSAIGEALIAAASNTKVTRTLQVLCAVGFFFKYVNSYLNQRALNFGYNGESAKFVWPREIAVVTGGSGGLGKLQVEGLARAGLKKVIIMDVAEPAFDLPSNVVFYKTDLTQGDEITRVGDLIRKEIGHPTIVVNNAGLGCGKTILGSTERSIKLTFNVNAIAPFLVTKEFLPNMIENNHGHIVTIASMASFISPAQMVDYAASKAAALSFSEGLSQELKHRYKARGVRNTVVHPLWVKTPLTTVFKNMDSFFGRQLEPEEVSKAILDQILSGKGGQVMIPSSLTTAGLIRALPNWIQEIIRDDSKEMVIFNKDF